MSLDFLLTAPYGKLAFLPHTQLQIFSPTDFNSYSEFRARLGTQSKRPMPSDSWDALKWHHEDKVLQPGDLPEAGDQNDVWLQGSVCLHSISDTFLFLLNNPQMKTSTNHSCRCRNLSFDFLTVFVSNSNTGNCTVVEHSLSFFKERKVYWTD